MEELNHRVLCHSNPRKRKPDFFSRINNTEVTDLSCTSLVEANESIICLYQLFTFTSDPENHKNLFGSIPEMMLEKIEFMARHGLMTQALVPFGQLSPVLLVEVLTIQRSFPTPSKLSSGIAFHLPVIINFLNQMASLDLSLCRRFRLLDELPIALQAMNANNATSLEWILTGSIWKLSEQLMSFGCSKLLGKNPICSNPRKKLLKVSIPSLYLFNYFWISLSLF